LSGGSEGEIHKICSHVFRAHVPLPVPFRYVSFRLSPREKDPFVQPLSTPSSTGSPARGCREASGEGVWNVLSVVRGHLVFLCEANTLSGRAGTSAWCRCTDTDTRRARGGEVHGQNFLKQTPNLNTALNQPCTRLRTCYVDTYISSFRHPPRGGLT
jgi:hypothetical protein